MPRKKTSKDLAPGPAPTPGNIPWGYGENRITAMARDPYWIFVYWEITDEAVARAQAEVRSPDAGCALRVYDTTFRAFDGTNANTCFDIPVDRRTNNYYVQVNRPGAVFHADIGVKSGQGYFAKIARSGAVELPRDSVSPDASVEWMTVASDRPAGPEYAHRHLPRQAPPPVAPLEVERALSSLVDEGWTRTEWTQANMRWVRWTGPFRPELWRAYIAGPFVRIEILLQGAPSGSWQVTVQVFEAGGGAKVIDRWEILSGGVPADLIVYSVLERRRAFLSPSREWRWLGGASEAMLIEAVSSESKP